MFLLHREPLLQLQLLPQLSREFPNNQLSREFHNNQLSRESQLHNQSSPDQLLNQFSQDQLLFLRELFPASLNKSRPDLSSPLHSSSLDSSQLAKANRDQLHSLLLVEVLPDRDQSSRSNRDQSSWEFLPRDQLQLLLNLPNLIADSSLRPDLNLDNNS